MRCAKPWTKRKRCKRKMDECPDIEKSLIHLFQSRNSKKKKTARRREGNKKLDAEDSETDNEAEVG